MSLGVDLSERELCVLLRVPQSVVREWVGEGCPVIPAEEGAPSTSQRKEFDFGFDPQNCSTRELANVFGLAPADVDHWVRQGCPFRSTGEKRSPRIFEVAAVFRWFYVFRARSTGKLEGELAEQDVRIWDLEWEIAAQKGEIPGNEDFH